MMGFYRNYTKKDREEGRSMWIIPFLIGIPVLLAVIFPFMKNEKIRGYVVYAGAGIVMLTTVLFIVNWILAGALPWTLYTSTELVDHLMVGRYFPDVSDRIYGREIWQDSADCTFGGADCSDAVYGIYNGGKRSVPHDG